jgi:vitamin B12 transporter
VSIPFIIKKENIALLLAMLFSFLQEGRAQKLSDTLREFQLKKRKKAFISSDSRIQLFSPGQKVTSIDSLTLDRYKMQSVANLLSQQVPVFVKSYGFNGLATLNFRGSSAAQSQVYWNGVPILNAALGIADISLLPVSFANKINLVFGSSSALLGSGNVGGALMLETAPPVFDSLNSHTYGVAAGAGSFGQYQLGLKGKLSSRKWYISANAFGQSAASEFSYLNDKGDEKINTNSRLRGLTLLTEAAYKANERSVVSLSGWYQQYYREIPPAFFDSISYKNQKDASLRLLLNWNRQLINGELYVKSAFLVDRMHYTDDAIQITTENTASQYYQEAGFRKRLGSRHQVMVFAPIHISWIDPPGGRKQQSRYALAAAYSYSDRSERLNLALSGRAELIDQQAVLLPGVNGSYAVFPWLTLRANVQKTYRAPSLNELYYKPGGNPSLRPEQGWSEEAGYKMGLKIGDKIKISHDLSVFNREIEDWILWFGGAIWTPHNVSRVHSRGIETESLVLIPIKKLKVHFGVNTSYVLATTIQSYYPNDGSIRKQLPYTPRYTGQVNLGFALGAFYFNYNQGYTGYRFINLDESPPYLEPYSIANVQVSYSIKLKISEVAVYFQANNIYASDYQVVAYRPMPGINWLAGMSCGLK